MAVGLETALERFEMLYKEFYPILYRVIHRMTGSDQAAEDVCQEAFIKYYEYAPRLPGGEQDKYWLIRVAKNMALNYEKKRLSEGKAVAQLKQSYQPAQNEGEKKALRDETQLLVQQALLRLPPKLRAPLVLKEYSGLNYKDIGKTLGISENNVKVRIFRARERLSKDLGKEDLYVPG